MRIGLSLLPVIVFLLDWLSCPSNHNGNHHLVLELSMNSAHAQKEKLMREPAHPQKRWGTPKVTIRTNQQHQKIWGIEYADPATGTAFTAVESASALPVFIDTPEKLGEYWGAFTRYNPATHQTINEIHDLTKRPDPQRLNELHYDLLTSFGRFLTTAATAINHPENHQDKGGHRRIDYDDVQRNFLHAFRNKGTQEPLPHTPAPVRVSHTDAYDRYAAYTIEGKRYLPGHRVQPMFD